MSPARRTGHEGCRPRLDVLCLGRFAAARRDRAAAADPGHVRCHARSRLVLIEAVKRDLEQADSSKGSSSPVNCSTSITRSTLVTLAAPASRADLVYDRSHRWEVSMINALHIKFPCWPGAQADRADRGRSRGVMFRVPAHRPLALVGRFF
jgi:hypothetical protein